MSGSDVGTPPHAIVAVHGRFQPFHAGHLEYVQLARTLGRFCYVGITNPDPTARRAEPEAEHRHQAEANPWTYFQRLAMVRAALDSAGVDPASVAIVPFPISDPERFSHYIPPEAVHVVRVFSEWEARKAERLRAAGYRVVEVAGAQPKPVAGIEIRRRLAAGEPLDGLVPHAVAALLAAWAPHAILR